MKNTQKCPKCSSSEVVLCPNHAGGGGIALGFLTAASLIRYVCCSCGFVETWVENQEDLTALKELYGPQPK